MAAKRLVVPPTQWVSLALLAAGILCPADVPATTMIRQSVEDLTHISSDVVQGSVSNVESRWTTDHRQILTFVTLSGVTPMKGAPAASVTFAIMGGAVGNDWMHVVGSPSFAVGEEVVVFLLRMPTNSALPVSTDRWLAGLSQGKWRVVVDPRTRVRMAEPTPGGAAIIERHGVGIETRLSLEALRARIRAASR